MQDIKAELSRLANPKAAEFAAKFFKTYDGGYAAGDKFLGLRVPATRKVAKKYKDLPLDQIEKLLESPIHEHRFVALVIMTLQFKKAGPELRKEIYDLYIRRTDRVNNWDLVDVSSNNIVGAYLADRPRAILYKLARSKDLWERRIAMVSTLYFIRVGELEDTFVIAEILLNDDHDLIHKAVGWMLRCAGDVDRKALLKFLDKHASVMPRTALRYCLEHLSSDQKAHYMAMGKQSKIKQ